MSRRLCLVVVLALAACGKELVLPGEPVAEVPQIAHFSPLSGHAGTRVTVEGRFLGHLASDVEVRFGASQATRPATLSDDGTRLEVDVPESASPSAPITVVTPAGRANSAESFTFLGAGRLLRGRVSTSVGLTPAVETAFPAGDEGELFVLFHFGDDPLGNILAAHADGTTRIADIGTPAFAMAPVGDGKAVGVFRFARHGEDCLESSDPDCVDMHGILSRYDPVALAQLPYTDHLADEEISFRLPSALELTRETRLAFSDSGDSALVISPGYPKNPGDPHAWVVDFDRFGGPVVAERVGASNFTQPAWLGGKQFLYAEGPFLNWTDAGFDRPFDPEGTLFLSPQAPHPLGITATATRGTTAAIATALGTVDLVDTATWPPSNPRPLDLLEREPAPRGGVGSLAFDSTGTRLAVVRPEADRVVVADVTKRSVLAALEVPTPKQVVGVGPYFYVGSPSGVFVVNAATGAFAGRFALHTKSPGGVLRRADCFGQSRDVLDVPVPVFGLVERFDPQSLQLLPCTGPELPPGKLLQVAAAPAGSTMVLRYDSDFDTNEPASIHVQQSDDVNRAVVHATVPDTFEDRAVVPLDAFPGADGSFYYWLASLGGDELGTLVTVVVAGEDFPETPPRFQLDGSYIAASEWDDALVLVGHTDVRVLDLAAARKGQVVERHRYPWNVDLVVRGSGAGVSAGRAWAMLQSENGDRSFASMSLTDGKPAEPLIVGGIEPIARPVVPPGANRLWFLQTADAAVHLRSFELDPRTGAVLGEEPPVSLPRGAKTLSASPDGEHALVVDGVEEQLLLLE